MKSKILSGLAALLLVVNAGQGVFAMSSHEGHEHRVPPVNMRLVRMVNASFGSDISSQDIAVERYEITTPLLRAVRRGNRAQVRELLARGENPNVRDSYEETPLTLAIIRGDADMVIDLLDAGADPTLHINPSNPNSQTALSIFEMGIRDFGDRTDEVRARLNAAGRNIVAGARSLYERATIERELRN